MAALAFAHACESHSSVFASSSMTAERAISSGAPFEGRLRHNNSRMQMVLLCSAHVVPTWAWR